MICYPWTVNHKVQGQDLEEFKHVKRWAEEIAKRPAVQKGMAVGANLSTDVTKLPPEEQARIRKLMYNQRAIPVPGRPAQKSSSAGDHARRRDRPLPVSGGVMDRRGGLRPRELVGMRTRVEGA